MASEWTVKETAIILGLTVLFFAAGYLLTGALQILSAVIALLVLGLWLLGALGKLGISAFR